MRITTIAAAQSFEREFCQIASDKSMSHRAAMFALLANAPCEVSGFLQGEDTLHTLRIAQDLGLQVERVRTKSARDNEETLIFVPPKQILEPSNVLDCGNAGTGMRLFTGLLCGVEGHFVLSGDCYLNARPMKRVIGPLNSIGARIRGRARDEYAPLSIKGSNLQPFDYVSPIASAQVKSAMILAALHTHGLCRFVEPALSRDHTENMLRGMGVSIHTRIIQPTIQGKKQLDTQGYEVSIDSPSLSQHKLEAFKIDIPADPSSAFYFAVAACVCQAKVKLCNVLLNPTRIEAFRVLEKMGAHIVYETKDSHYEQIGDIEVEGKDLHCVQVLDNIAWLIDEIPALGICFAIAKGKSEVRNAKELRIKESDRIHATIVGLRAMGIECEEFEDGFSVQGGTLKPARIQSFGDHRIAMSFAIAMLACGGIIQDSACIDVSFPNFLELLSQITQIENTKGGGD